MIKETLPLGLVSLAALLAGCAQTPQEHMVSTSPSWYLELPKDDGALYGAGMSLSPDLQFAIDKAMLQAKSVLADRVAGQTSVLSRSHASQSGNMVSRSDDKTVKNIAKDVRLGGYEIDKSAIMPEENGYRAYVLLKYVPTSGAGDSLDKAIEDVDSSQEVPQAVPPVAQPHKVTAVPKGMVIPRDDGEPPTPLGAPVPRVGREL